MAKRTCTFEDTEFYRLVDRLSDQSVSIEPEDVEKIIQGVSDRLITHTVSAIRRTPEMRDRYLKAAVSAVLELQRDMGPLRQGRCCVLG